jgi:phage antirepressor YoqD-like protein
MLAEVCYKEGKLGVDEIAKTVGISKMSLYKYLRMRGVRIGSTDGKQLNEVN